MGVNNTSQNYRTNTKSLQETCLQTWRRLGTTRSKDKGESTIGIIPPLCPHWGSRLARRALLPHVARPALLMAILAEMERGQITRIQFVPFLVCRCRPCLLQRRTEVAKLLPPTRTKRFAVCTGHSQRKGSESRNTALSQTSRTQKT